MKHQAVMEYLKQYPPLDHFLKINTSLVEVGDVSFNTVANDEVVEEYTSGMSDREYTFTVVEIQKHSDGYNKTNLTSLGIVEDFMNWIREQNQNGNFPNFGNECEVYQIKNLHNMPSLSGVDKDKARYIFSIKISYTERN